MAQHLRLEAILTVPPSLPLTLIITAFQPASLKVSSSRQDVAVVVVEIICACKEQLEECGYIFTPLHAGRKQTSVNHFFRRERLGKEAFSQNEHKAVENLVDIQCLLNDPSGLSSKQEK